MNTLLSDSASTPASGGSSGQTLRIRGGRPLRGRVEVKGAKNLATKAMVAALLGETASILRDVPDISDVHVVRSLLEVHGVRVEDLEDGVLRLDPSGAVSAHMEEIDAHAGASRIPILFCGPLLHLLGQAFIPDLGDAASATARSTSTSMRSARSAPSSTSCPAASVSPHPTACMAPTSSCRTRAWARRSRSS